MAQAAGKCLDAEFRTRGRAMLVQIKFASFRIWVRPGETARIFAAIVSNQKEVAVAHSHVEVGGRKVCSAELLFAFMPLDRFAPGLRDDVLMKYLEAHRSTTETTVPKPGALVAPGHGCTEFRVGADIGGASTACSAAKSEPDQSGHGAQH